MVIKAFAKLTVNAVVSKVKRLFASGAGIFIALSIILVAVFATNVLAVSEKQVELIVDGAQTHTVTVKNTVNGVLAENGISLIPEDYINVSPDLKLNKEENNVIIVKKAVPVNVFTENGGTVLLTCHETVQAAIMYSPIVMDTDDRFEGVLFSDPVKAGMDIRIVRVDVRTETVKEPIPYEVEYVRNNYLERGTEVVVRDGSEGLLERVERIVCEDGVEVTRETVAESVISEAVNKIVESGTLATYTTARGGTIRYTDKLTMSSVAYSAVIDNSDPGNIIYGRTYSGHTARKGVIAVDPGIIPLGSRLYVEVYGSTPDYGYAIASDTGSDIKGNIVDLCFDSYAESVWWGRKMVNIYILADN